MAGDMWCHPDEVTMVDPMEELHWDLIRALQRAYVGVADEDDMKVICYVCGIKIEEIKNGT